MPDDRVGVVLSAPSAGSRNRNDVDNRVDSRVTDATLNATTHATVVGNALLRSCPGKCHAAVVTFWLHWSWEEQWRDR